MNHADHVRLIRGGVEGSGPRWLELGAGEGAFTLALADCLGPGTSILALDRDRGALGRLGQVLAEPFPRVAVETLAADFRTALPAGPFDGILAANSLHFTDDPVAVLREARMRLADGGRVVVVEYDADRGNPWVPHPFSAAHFPDVGLAAGLGDVMMLERVPSRFLNAIWSAVARPAPAPRG